MKRSVDLDFITLLNNNWAKMMMEMNVLHETVYAQSH